LSANSEACAEEFSSERRSFLQDVNEINKTETNKSLLRSLFME